MKEKYLELMSKALSAYSDEHIHEYFERVKAANDFSVREIAFCLLELERIGKFSAEIKRWKALSAR